MTNNNHRRLKKTTIAFAAVVLGGYLLWVATPLNENIEVNNSAGISDQDVVAVIDHARSRGAFSDEQVRKLAEYRWTPWRRGVLFIDIQGDVKHIRVEAGFALPKLDGCGPVFSGEMTTNGWQFKDTGGWVI